MIPIEIEKKELGELKPIQVVSEVKEKIIKISPIKLELKPIESVKDKVLKIEVPVIKLKF